jgi:hypothetical protein
MLETAPLIVPMETQEFDQIKNYLLQREYPSYFDKNAKKGLRQKCKRYQLQGNSLFVTISHDRLCKVVRTENVEDILKEHHRYKNSYHHGINATYNNLIEKNLYWKGMSEDVKRFVGKCTKCRHANLFSTHESDPESFVSHLTYSSLSLLDKKEGESYAWLNDELLDYYWAMLAEKNDLVFVTSLQMKGIQCESIPTKKKVSQKILSAGDKNICFILNISENHWICGFWYIKSNLIRLYDPLMKNRIRSINWFLNYINEDVVSECNNIEVKMDTSFLKQNDTFNCGVYICMYLKSKVDPFISITDPIIFRVEMKKEILGFNKY